MNKKTPGRYMQQDDSTLKTEGNSAIRDNMTEPRGCWY